MTRCSLTCLTTRSSRVGRSADNSAAMTPTNMMSTDVRENDKGYDVDIDMPGFKKDDISVVAEQRLSDRVRP